MDSDEEGEDYEADPAQQLCCLLNTPDPGAGIMHQIWYTAPVDALAATACVVYV